VSRRHITCSPLSKNDQLEYIFKRPKFLTTCIYGIAFILLGNISGNAIAFALFVAEAAGRPQDAQGIKDNHGFVIGVAFAALTAAVLLHVCSRRGGIIMSNAFACIKVLILVVIIILGFTKAAGEPLGGKPKANNDNFDPDLSLAGGLHDPTGYFGSLLYVCYSYAGFNQPFYVLSEVKSPKKRFPTFTLLAMFIASCLYVLVNVAYFCAVPKGEQLNGQSLATVFFGDVFGKQVAKRVMAGLIALSIFGNIVVITFTAARVKQEIAKEGILPLSLFFATGHTTPYAWLKAKWRNAREYEYMEQTPMAALALHWASSVLLIAVTSMLDSKTAYTVLVSLYGYVIVFLVGFFVSGGLLYLTFSKRNWSHIANFRPWGSPAYAIIYFLACGCLLFASFVKPSKDSPLTYANNSIQWYIVPAISLSTLLWGSCWYLGLKLDLWRKHVKLIVNRRALIMQDEDDLDQWIQVAEIVDHEHHTKTGPKDAESLEMR
jgi:amino acid transporter